VKATPVASGIGQIYQLWLMRWRLEEPISNSGVEREMNRRKKLAVSRGKQFRVAFGGD